MKKTVIFAAVIATALLSGCATDQMKQDIAAAKSAAAAAQKSADDAAAAAAAADSKADRALTAAQGAQSCCDANSQKIDRMFHKAMMK